MALWWRWAAATSLCVNAVPEADVHRERDLLREQALESGKPAQVSPGSFQSLAYRIQSLLSTTPFHHLLYCKLDHADAHSGN